MSRIRAEEIASVESEAGVLASLAHHPEFYFHSDDLLPNHFSNEDNRYLYVALGDLAMKGVKQIDAYNIVEALKSNEGTARYGAEVPMGVIQDFMDNKDVIARHTLQDYRLCVSNVINAAYRRDTLQCLRRCEGMCRNQSIENIGLAVSRVLDEVLLDFSATAEIPSYDKVIDECWEQIKSRQENGAAGIPFKFPALNEYATIEAGELFIFGAEQKQGKCQRQFKMVRKRRTKCVVFRRRGQ